MPIARAAFAFVLAIGCTALAAAPVEKKPLKLGISPAYGMEQAENAKKLIEPYLTAALGSPVTVVVMPGYEELSDALASGAVDLAWITPLAFVRASQKNAYVQALSKAMRAGDAGLSYRSVFAVKSGSSIKTLADMKGKKVVWVNKLSTSGYLFPRELLRKEGHDPDKFFAGEAFGGDHPAACKVVREGKADVVATFASGTADVAALKADGCADAPPITDFRVVASTGNLPNEVIAASSDFPTPRVNDVIGTFGRMGKTDAGKKLLADAFRCTGWGVAVDGDFAPVLELLNAKDVKALVAPSQAPPARDPKKSK
jgi:phosphonate transport system substrate-binding protein